MDGGLVEERGGAPKGGGRSLTLHIYVRGQGPKFVVEEQLLGWDADRLNVRAILRKHRLKALYAFSSAGQRGLQLTPLPRNGLSLTTYSGRAGAIVHLDSEPQVLHAHPSALKFLYYPPVRQDCVMLESGKTVSSLIQVRLCHPCVRQDSKVRESVRESGGPLEWGTVAISGQCPLRM